MSERSKGWAFVAGQTILLVALIAVPRADHWSTPAWVGIAGMVMVVIGLGIIAIAALRLGPALTPTPVPTTDARLRTDGLYRWVRHPIYTGVLLAVAGVTVRSGSALTLAVAGAWTIVQWNLDRTLGTTFLTTNEALMIEYIWVTLAGLAAGVLFDLYFRPRSRRLRARLGSVVRR